MIFLWILLALVALILFFLFTNVHIVFHYREKAKISFRFLFFRVDGSRAIRILSGGKNKKEHAKPLENIQKTKERKSADILGFIEFLGHITWVIKETVLDYLSNTTVNLKELKVLVASDDAARTAVYYGTAIQAANGLCALLQYFSKFRWKDDNLVIEPDFSKDKSEFAVHLILSTKLIHWIMLYVRANLRFFEGKDIKYEPNSVKASDRSISGKH